MTRYLFIIFTCLVSGLLQAQQVSGTRLLSVIADRDTAEYVFFFTPSKLTFGNITRINNSTKVDIWPDIGYLPNTAFDLFPDSIWQNGKKVFEYSYLHAKVDSSFANFDLVCSSDADTLFCSYNDCKWEKRYEYSAYKWKQAIDGPAFKNVYLFSVFSKKAKASFMGLDSIRQIYFEVDENTGKSGNTTIYRKESPSTVDDEKLYESFTVEVHHRNKLLRRRALWKSAEASNIEGSRQPVAIEYFFYRKGKLKYSFFISFVHVAQNKKSCYTYEHGHLRTIQHYPLLSVKIPARVLKSLKKSISLSKR